MALIDDTVTGVKSTANNIGTAASQWMEQKLGSYASSFGANSPAFNVADGKYNVSQLTYPVDLFGSDYQYGGNYVVFYINVAEDSKLLSQSGEATVEVDANERLRAAINQTGLTTQGIIAGATAAGSGLGTILGALGGGGGGAAGGGLLGGILGAAAAGIVSAATGGKMSRQQKRLKSAIALNVPNQLNIRYSTNWAEEDTAAYQAMSQLGEGGMKALDDALKNKTANNASADQSQKSGLTGTAASVATALALNTPGGVGAGLSASSGLAPNPKKEQIFKGVDFRTFVFDYQFSPRNEKEAQNVLNIIQQFKLHMHPEFKDTASFVFIYPSEFDIHYYFRSGDNTTIHKHTSCVLTDLNINYTPNGQFSTFANGMPTQINIQMTFKELAILTKEAIQMGF